MAKPRRKNKKKQRISPLLALPREIRDDIYYYALDWPNLNNTFKMLEGREAMLEEEHRKLHPKQPRCRLPKPRMQFQTPGILLANQQIYAETIDVLRRKPLIIPGPPPLCYATGREYDITDVVGEETLQNAHYVTLEIDFLYWSWDHVVDSLLELWSVKQSLRMLFVKVSRKPIAGHVALDLPLDSSKYRFSPGRHGFIHTTILSKLLHLSYEVPITVEGCEGELFDYRMVKGYGNGRIPNREKFKTKALSYCECVDGFTKEVHGCSRGGRSKYNNWIYDVKANDGHCVDFGYLNQNPELMQLYLKV